MLILLIYKPRNRYKQNYFVSISSLSKKRKLIKNDIIHLFLNTFPNKFLKDMLVDKKVIDQKLGYAIIIYTSQGMTLKVSQHVWVIDENLV